jgi:hypothetical protein
LLLGAFQGPEEPLQLDWCICCWHGLLVEQLTGAPLPAWWAAGPALVGCSCDLLLLLLLRSDLLPLLLLLLLLICRPLLLRLQLLSGRSASSSCRRRKARPRVTRRRQRPARQRR